MALSSLSFDFVRAVLRERSGHHLEDDKAYLVETRLLPVARRHGLASVDDLVQRLRSRPNENLIGELVEAMTINETFFFRDDHPWGALRHAVLPELIRLRSTIRSLNIWSAACSSGQEAYSIAIMLCHDFPMLAGWHVRLIGSDISMAVLERARRGRYSDLEVARGLAPELLHRYFKHHKDGWHIRDDLRRIVEFRRINLSEPWPDLPPLDLILLRNVLIYFAVPTRQEILRKVRRVLQPDGYLLLGGAETTHNLDDAFVPVSIGPSSLYQHRGERTA